MTPGPPRTAPGALVRAAGGVVWRPGSAGEAEVVVVHRPRYDDWSLPKGKCDPGEPDEACALREVEEETGWQCVLGPELATVSYVDRQGRSKYVRYWAMTLIDDGEFVVNAEVDDARWLTVSQACVVLTYERDRELLAAFAAARQHVSR